MGRLLNLRKLNTFDYWQWSQQNLAGHCTEPDLLWHWLHSRHSVKPPNQELERWYLDRHTYSICSPLHHAGQHFDCLEPSSNYFFFLFKNMVAASQYGHAVACSVSLLYYWHPYSRWCNPGPRHYIAYGISHRFLSCVLQLKRKYFYEEVT